jgi:hypothetical protein
MVAEPLRLLQQEALGLERETVAVEEVSGDEKGVYVLANGEVDGASERLAGSVSESRSHGLGSPREGRVEVDVGNVQEAHGAN